MRSRGERMRIAQLRIERFRSIRSATLFPVDHNVYLGPTNLGKTAILEALNLLLNPEIATRGAVVDEKRLLLPRVSAAAGGARHRPYGGRWCRGSSGGGSPAKEPPPAPSQKRTPPLRLRGHPSRAILSHSSWVGGDRRHIPSAPLICWEAIHAFPLDKQ